MQFCIHWIQLEVKPLVALYLPLLSFGPSAIVPARLIRWLRLSAPECLVSLADDMTYDPLLTSALWPGCLAAAGIDHVVFEKCGDPHGFIGRQEIVDYLDGYVASFNPPRQGVTVTSLKSNTQHGFRLETSEGPYSADRS